MDRPHTIETRRSLPALRAIQALEKFGFRHEGVGRFVNDDGDRAEIKLVRPGVFKVRYFDRAGRKECIL